VREILGVEVGEMHGSTGRRPSPSGREEATQGTSPAWDRVDRSQRLRSRDDRALALQLHEPSGNLLGRFSERRVPDLPIVLGMTARHGASISETVTRVKAADL
jgi:hypothetical protein